MIKRVFLYTPWQEQGLSYDAKVIEQLYKQKSYETHITYRTKKKVKWECSFHPIKTIHNIINPEDVFFSFEVFPNRYLPKIAAVTKNLFHMVNYEFYEPDLQEQFKLYKNIFCKSKIALDGLRADGLSNVSYQPWILYDFPIGEYRPIADTGLLKILFNGATGGYKERRNLAAVVQLIEDYKKDDVNFTLKLTKRVQRWSRSILKKHAALLANDPRVTLIQEDLSHPEYISFLSEFDVNLAPSKFEGFGLTLLEALHANLPTLTMDISPLNEIVEHEKTGHCVKAEQVDILRNQPIYQTNREDLLKGFSELIRDRDHLNRMKRELPRSIKDSIRRFNEGMERSLFE